MAKQGARKPRYRLSFGGTRKKKWAWTYKHALADAKYWTGFGQKQVCIDERLPTGTFRRLKCVTR